ncbi:MAG TPA: caspase family protein [Campylobacterales bacterium]|nr:caspase family protein [Campylobacterales bacterium]
MKKGQAVCIRMNSINPEHYGTKGELYICEKDADDMHNILMLNGFVSLKLTTKEATRDNVKNAILDSAKELKSGDIMVIYYSGHGGKVPNVSSPYDIEYDNVDETWCLWDAQLLDDELRNLWASFDEGVRIVLPKI